MKNQTYVIYCDFDGTVSKRDTLVLLFDKYVDKNSLVKYATLWEQGIIGSDKCLRELFRRVTIERSDLHSFINDIQIDEHFIPFIDRLNHNVVFNILSDGVDIIIYNILKNHGVANKINHVFCNQLRHSRYQNRVFFSSHDEKMGLCQHQQKCALCKSAIMEEASKNNTNKLLYIGDGQSDYYGAMQADIVFAKKKLYDYLLERGKSNVYLFNTFKDIFNYLKSSALNEAIFSA